MKSKSNKQQVNKKGKALGTARKITRERKTKGALMESEERYRMLIETLPTRVWTKNKNSVYQSCNKAYADDLGIKKEDIEGKTDYDFFQKEQAGKYRKDDMEVMKSGKVKYIEEMLIRNGKELYVNTVKAPLRDKNGNIYGVLGSFWDITDKKKADDDLRDSENRFKILFEYAPDAYFLVDLKGNFVNANMAAEGLLGFRKKELIGKNFVDLKLLSQRQVPIAIKILAKAGLGQLTGPDELILTTKDSNKIIVEVRAILYKIKSRTLVLAIARDITERKEAEKQIRYLSFHDKLTGLYNRAYLEEELKRLDTGRQLPLSIVMGDSNGLKLINDTFGHAEGDKMLQKTAEILKSCTRKEDIIARWGGDEFLILLPKTTREKTVELVNRIRDKCSMENTKKMPLSISLGIAIKEKTTRKIKDVLKEAENNMYKHKLSDGKSTFGSILPTLEETLFMKSNETKEHGKRMGNLAMKLGRVSGLPEDELDKLYSAALFHDIGNIGIPEKIILKRGKLTDEEWEIIKKHPEIGYCICNANPQLSNIADVVICHHEWWDGSGYPRGIKGDNIPITCRIISIVDAYDVMTHYRPYGKPMSKGEAIEELKRYSGKQFEPKLVKKFIEIISSK